MQSRLRVITYLNFDISYMYFTWQNIRDNHRLNKKRRGREAFDVLLEIFHAVLKVWRAKRLVSRMQLRKWIVRDARRRYAISDPLYVSWESESDVKLHFVERKCDPLARFREKMIRKSKDIGEGDEKRLVSRRCCRRGVSLNCLSKFSNIFQEPLGRRRIYVPGTWGRYLRDFYRLMCITRLA